MATTIINIHRIVNAPEEKPQTKPNGGYVCGTLPAAFHGRSKCPKVRD